MATEAPDSAEIAELRARVAELEQELRKRSADQLMSRTILETIPAVVLRVSLDGVIEFVNRVLPEYSSVGLVGQSIYVFAPLDQHDAMREALERTIRTRQMASYETIAEAPDGTRDWYLTSVGPILDGDQLLGLTLICINTSRWKAAEEELARSRAQLSLALEAGNVGLWHWDRVHDVVEWDDKLCAMFGLTRENAPRTKAAFVDLLPPDQREAMNAHIEQSVQHGVYPDFQLRADMPTGTRWFIIKGGVMRDAAGNVIGLLGGVVDDTERKKLEEHVYQTQKLEAVGHLSAGIAHNFNNMLAVIMPTLEMARSAMPEQGVYSDAVESASHAAQLVRQLMVFSRGHDVEATRKEALSEVVRRAVDLCRKTFDRHIELELTGSEGVRDVLVDAADIEQVMVNILLNARDAIEAAPSGPSRIRVKLRKLSTEETLRRHPGAKGQSAEVCVIDTGVGMGEETRGRIFEPFFTTKAPGSGTGLGLSTAWAMVRAHGGLLECDSAPGRGSTFTLLLSTAPPDADEHAAASSPQAQAFVGSSALVIDDEPAVRRMLTKSLELLGFSVSGAASGVEGVDLARSSPIDVVFLDYSMPGQLPEETLKQLREVQPGVPVICCSGLGVELAGATAVLAKPFGLAELSTLLARVLGTPRT